MTEVSAINATPTAPLDDSPLPSSSSASSTTGDVDSCEGYLVVTFSKSTKPPPAPDSRLEVTAPLSINPSSPAQFGTKISRLAAVAAGVDPSRLQRWQNRHSNNEPSPSSFPLHLAPSTAASSCLVPTPSEYVRRFTYPDGDTHYDWLSCPLSEMQAKGPSQTLRKAPSVTPASLAAAAAAAASSSTFLVYESSLPPANPTPTYRRQMTSSRKMLRCEECGKYYGNEYSLHHHICLRRKDVWKKGDVPTRIVDGQMIHFCPVCSKPFKWLGNLTRHYYVHTGQRFFKCDICHKEFFSAYQVRRHMNSHTGLRFQCAVCEKPFTCKYACAWHARQHFKESGGGLEAGQSHVQVVTGQGVEQTLEETPQ